MPSSREQQPTYWQTPQSIRTLVTGWGDPRRPPGPPRPLPDVVRLTSMEAVFIALMAAVVLLSAFVSLVVLYKLMKADNS